MSTVNSLIDDKLLTSPQAANYLGISPRTLFTLKKKRKIRSVRVGHQVRYDPADLRAFVEASKAEPVTS